MSIFLASIAEVLCNPCVRGTRKNRTKKTKQEVNYCKGYHSLMQVYTYLKTEFKIPPDYFPPKLQKGNSHTAPPIIKI